MKLKSFGLVEAIIATGILLLFITGIFYLSAKGAQRTSQYERNAIALKITEDFFSRVEVLDKSGRINYGSGDSKDKIPVSCLESSKSFDCLNELPKTFPLDLYPFHDMTTASKGDYLELKNIEESMQKNAYKIQTSLIKAGDQYLINLSIKWEHARKSESLSLTKTINLL